MARPRLQQSLADYLAIAISPALIMLLVGSLVFFLQEMTYDGAFAGRVRWMLFWFVFATVLIARIGIEFGRSHAAMYAGALALACAVFAHRFLEEYFVGVIVLMGVIWWCVNKLTWDCTFIDDAEDSSGVGLLQQSGIERPSEEEEDAGKPVVETTRQRRRRERREQLLADQSTVTDAPSRQNDSAPDKRSSHSPGVWVVYFSLLALPLFGVGEAFLSRDDPSSRAIGFRYLWVYVASALGLLLTTSFLGLRRYLRQRHIEMPVAITARWIVTGTLMIAAVLLVCLLIPRPSAETSVTALLDRFAKEQQANNYAVSANDAGEGAGREVGETREGDGEPGDRIGEDGAPAESDEPGQQSGGERKGESRGADQQDANSREDGEATEQSEPNPAEEEQTDQQKENVKKALAENEPRDQDDGKQGQSPPESQSSWSPPEISWLTNGIKWLIYIVLACLILFGLIRNWNRIVEGGREFFRSLANFWRNLFAGQRQPGGAGETGSELDPVAYRGKRFLDYPNPFLTGEAHRMRPDALVIYTEQALRTFGFEQGVSRDEELTTIEFGREVEARVSELGSSIQFLTQTYSRILYSSRPPTSFDIQPLEPLWAGMTRFVQSGRVAEVV